MFNDFVAKLEKVEHVPLSKKVQKVLFYLNVLVAISAVFILLMSNNNGFFEYIIFGLYIIIAILGIIGIKKYSKSLNFKDLVLSLIVPIMLAFTTMFGSVINLFYRAFF